ncbi:MAG: hypothetical protein ABI904_15475 [Chloroflexota bacterium]
MKTFGRVLVIVIAFAILMGVTYSVVSASGSSNTAPVFQRDGRDGFAPNDGQREFGGREREGGAGGFGMLFGLLKNTIIVAVITALIVLPKNFFQQKRRAVPVKIN